MHERTTIAVLASDCHFARAALGALRGHGVTIAAVGRLARPMSPLTRSRASIPIAVPDPLALACGLDAAVEVGTTGRGLDGLALPDPLVADILLSVCFPNRVPACWRAAARVACVNLHPSMLPGYRGPAPVFWQLRDGIAVFGISVHHLDDGFDTGPIAAQAGVPVPIGATIGDIEAMLAARGAALLADLIAGGARAFAASRGQDEAAATRQGWPRPDDYTLDTSWPVERALRFMRGVAAPGIRFRIQWADTEVLAERAIARIGRGEAPAPPGTLDIALRDGDLRVLGAAAP